MPKKSPRKFISIVVPIYNEEEVIPELIRQLHVFADAHKQYRYEFILVEHGSKDSSYKLLQKQAKKDKRLKVLQLAKNVECDGGLVAGMNFASGDACVLLMADLQEPLSVVTKFFKQWEKGYEIVYGVVKKRTGGRIRNLNSRIFYKVMNLLTGNVFPENVSDFRLMDKKVYKAIIKMPEQNKYLRGLVMWTGFSSIGVEFARVDRFAGESKADFKTVLKVASNGIFSFSYFPLSFSFGCHFGLLYLV